MLSVAGAEVASKSPISAAPGPGGPGASPTAAIDVERLADRVYGLLLDEARLSWARGEPVARRLRQPGG